ncbi:MAG TPA: HdeD family acid-resistance protein [Bryobacteraceae bacterium]|jgi:uncharacterized membrane protein HdeD (DUF308 family)|nr:HdeD family acid-resistance protein [Bryobacteraceae bacterium]
MVPLLATNWWSLVIRGVLAIVVGLVAFALPGITFGALVILFGAYALLDGILGIAGALRASRAHERWGWLLFEGIAGIVAAAITVFWPAITALALVYVIGFWAVLTGVFEIGTAIQLRRYVPGEWLLILTGIVSIIFGVLVFAVPLAGAFAIAVCVGVYATFFGILMVSLGIRLKGRTRTLDTGSPVPLPSR